MKIKEIKKEEADKRQKERKKRGPAEQLGRLDKKLGNGIGAKGERARLTAQIVRKVNKKKGGEKSE